VVLVAEPDELGLLVGDHRLDLSVSLNIAHGIIVDVLVEKRDGDSGDIVLVGDGVVLPGVGGPFVVELAEHAGEGLLHAVLSVLGGNLGANSKTSKVLANGIVLTSVVVAIVERFADVIQVGGFPVWSENGVDLVVSQSLVKVGHKLDVSGHAEGFVGGDSAKGFSDLVLPLFTAVPVVSLGHSPVVEEVVELVVLSVGEFLLPVAHGSVVGALGARGVVMAVVAESAAILLDVGVVGVEHAAVVLTWHGEANEAGVLDDASGLSDHSVDVSGGISGEFTHHDEGLLATSAEGNELGLSARKAIGFSLGEHGFDEGGEILLTDLILGPVPEFHGTIGGIIGVTRVSTEERLVEGSGSGSSASVRQVHIVSEFDELGGDRHESVVFCEPGLSITVFSVDENDGTELTIDSRRTIGEIIDHAEHVQIVAFGVCGSNGGIDISIGLNHVLGESFVELAVSLSSVTIGFEVSAVGPDANSSLGIGGKGGGGSENLESFHFV